MFNRTIETRIVKKSKKDETPSDEPTLKPEDITANAVAFLGMGGKQVMKMVATYIALDTARKIAIARLGK